MRVTHIFKAVGLAGAEAHILTLTAALKKEGFDCDLIILAEPGRMPADVIREADSRGAPYAVEPIRHDFDLSLIARLARRLQSRGAQLVHTHMIHADLYGTLAAGRARVAVVQSRHNHDRFRRLWPLSWMLAWAARPAKTVIAISDSLAGFVRDVEGVPGPKIKRIYYGLDPASVTRSAAPGRVRAELGLAAAAPVAAFAGRLVEQKGVRYLIEAWGRVQAALPTARLLVAGDGPLRESLQRQAEPFGESIRFLGWRGDVPSLMADCDLLAVPSLWEGFGLVTLEAMALSKPVVACRVGALPEIVIDGDTGRLVPPKDPTALAEALATLLSDPAQATALGERGRKRLEKEFSVGRMAREHAVVYREAASRVPEFRA